MAGKKKDPTLALPELDANRHHRPASGRVMTVSPTPPKRHQSVELDLGHAPEPCRGPPLRDGSA